MNTLHIARADAVVSTQMVRFDTSLSKESIVTHPKEPKATTQQVEVQVRKVYCINRAIPTLPINLEDAAGSEAEFDKAEKAREKSVLVLQDTRLNYRAIDLWTPANQAIFCIQCHVENIHTQKFREFLFFGEFYRDPTQSKVDWWSK